MLGQRIAVLGRGWSASPVPLLTLQGVGDARFARWRARWYPCRRHVVTSRCRTDSRHLTAVDGRVHADREPNRSMCSMDQQVQTRLARLFADVRTVLAHQGVTDAGLEAAGRLL